MFRIIALLMFVCFIVFFVFLSCFERTESLATIDHQQLNVASVLNTHKKINTAFVLKDEPDLIQKSDLTVPVKFKVSKNTFENAIVQGVLPDVDLTEVKKGVPVLVHNFIDPKLEPSFFTPFWRYGYVVAVSIERQYTNGEKIELAQVMPINDTSWVYYPPITQADAESRLLEYIDTSYMYEGLVYDVPHIPEHLFKVSDLDELFLVNAYSGEVRTAPKEKAGHNEKPMLKMNSDGVVEFIPENMKDISDEEMRALRRELEEENRAIKEGLLKLDKEFNVIYDKRQFN